MLLVCRRHAGLTDPSRVARLLQEARDVAFHLDSVRTHKVHCRTKIPTFVQAEACFASWTPFWYTHSSCNQTPEDRIPRGWHAGLQELLYSYNIGVDRQKRQRQKLSDSARSVGLSLPDWSN